MAERRLRLKLGVFLALTLVVLAGLVVFFGRAPDLFSNKASYTILFPEAPGIGPGTPIRKSGVRIGEVSGVDLDPETGQVRVAVRVDRKFLPRKTEEANITKGLLSGDAAIDFLPHLAEEGAPYHPGEVYPPGSEIVGVPPITPRSLLTPASGMLVQAQSSLDRIVKAFEKLEKLERLEPVMQNAFEEIANLAHDARLFIPELKKTNDRFQNLLGRTCPNLPAGLIAAQQPPVDQPSVKSLIHDIQELVRSVRPAVAELSGTVKSARAELRQRQRSALSGEQEADRGAAQEHQRHRRVCHQDFDVVDRVARQRRQDAQEHRRPGDRHRRSGDRRAAPSPSRCPCARMRSSRRSRSPRTS